MSSDNPAKQHLLSRQLQTLLFPHEMGELFKVIVLSHPRHTATVNAAGGYIGFQSFDRSHTL